MNKFIILASLLTITSCTFLQRRNVANTSPSQVVKFYDAANCELRNCAENQFDLQGASGRSQFHANLKQLMELSKSAAPLFPKSKNMDDLIEFHLGHEGIRAGVETLLVQIETDRPDLAKATNEVFAAIKNNFRPPLETTFQFFYLPIMFTKLLTYNSVTVTSPEGDLQDPSPSTFWQNRSYNPAHFATGYDRESSRNFSSLECSYDKAKSGFGVHPGFHIKCGHGKYKLKLGSEVHSAVLNSRLYWAMGYNVPIVDFVETPKIKYQRKILTEFNSRRIENFRVQLGDHTVFQVDNERYYSPFAYVKEVVLKDQQRINVEELQSRLFNDAKKLKPELDPQNYNVSFEEQIDYFIMVPSAYIEKSDDEEIGPWRYDQLEHASRRELRGVQLLAAWVGNFDMRMDNSRLVRDGKTQQIKHVFSDVGSGLGESSFILTKGSGLIEKMTWTVTRTIGPTESDPTANERVEINGLMNIENNRAFRSMSFDDGRWMVNKLCAVTSEDLKTLVQTAGLRSSLAALAFNKIISRRNQMVRDFKMESTHATCILPFDK